MASLVKIFCISPFIALSSEHKPSTLLRAQSLDNGYSSKLDTNPGGVHRVSSIGNYGHQPKLGMLWDDGYGTRTVKDYLDIGKDMIKPDGGPPRWFCPIECGPPIKDSPVLLFLPGIDGLGLGLILHHKALGKVFEVRCMHVPVFDRTPFEGLVNFVNSTVRLENALHPHRPIYLVGESLGGCLALAVAAHNPTIDLVGILVNPGDPMKLAMVNVKSVYSPAKKLQQFLDNLSALLPCLPVLVDIIPKSTFLWKLKLLKSSAGYANSRLHAVKADVLVLASCKDRMLPSGDEAHRLASLMENCQVRYFRDNGHSLLMEDGINLLTIIKGTCKYRCSTRSDIMSDFLPPSMSEFEHLFDQRLRLLHLLTSPVMFSTLEDGKIVRGLAGVPNEGPVLLVGYHMLFGPEVGSLVEEFLREKNVLVRGMAHPDIFSPSFDPPYPDFPFDSFKVFGALPATPGYLFKLLSTKSFVLLYPGGVHEALHHKGDEYKLVWPENPEFVRVAARHGATIVPFGVVGEDDLIEIFPDYSELVKIPVLHGLLRQISGDPMTLKVRLDGEVSNHEFFVPRFCHKIPGRIYFLFGKPMETREEMLSDKEYAKEFFSRIKSAVECSMSYLIKKREEDPYRGIFERIIYRSVSTPLDQVPAFKP